MSAIGGLYGDYGICKSTRVLEKRRSAEQIYKNRLFNARGGYNNCYIGSLFGFATYFVLQCSSLNPRLRILAGLGASTTPYLFQIFYDKDLVRYLKNNKASIIEDLNVALINDHKERSGIYPSVEIVEAVENVENVESVEESSADADEE